MKKLISIFLIVALCGAFVFALASCEEEHVHACRAEWAKDQTHHWHECEGEGCTEINGKEEHTWGEGAITKDPTKDAKGEKTYTCTVCFETKTEEVEYTPKTTVTAEEWAAALAGENYYNVTLIYKEYSYDEETGTASSGEPSVYKYDGDQMSVDGEVRANLETDMDSEEVIGIVAYGLNKYAEAEYDAVKHGYVVKIYNDYYEMHCGLVYQFLEGELVHFEYHFLPDDSLDGMYKDRWLYWDFSDYGTTSIS